MASGILLESGQNWVLDCMKEEIDNTYSGLYVGLMTNASRPDESGQLGNGITEITGSGYAREACTNWVRSSGVDPYLQGDTVTFNASGTWSGVNGYFVSITESGNDAIWSEVFPSDKTGNKYSGDRMLITPKYEQKYENEA